MEDAILDFKIHYATPFGQTLVLCLEGAHAFEVPLDTGAKLAQVENDITKCLTPIHSAVTPKTFTTQKNEFPMIYHDGGYWTLRLSMPLGGVATYRYKISCDGGREFYERGQARPLYIEDSKYTVLDKWMGGGLDEIFYTTTFARNLYNRRPAPKLNPDTIVMRGEIAPTGHSWVEIRVWEPRVWDYEELFVVGSSSHLGKWNLKHARPMNMTGYPLSTLKIAVPETDFPLEYKFVLRSGREEPWEWLWEDGSNHVISRPTASTTASTTAITSQKSRTASASSAEVVEGGSREVLFGHSSADSALSPAVSVSSFESFDISVNITTIATDNAIVFPRPLPLMAGLSVPVFSLRSKEGMGIGELPDLLDLVRWAQSCGLQVVHLAPLFDTSFTMLSQDSNPYVQVSSFAMHPIYIGLNRALDHLTGIADAERTFGGEPSSYADVASSFADRIAILTKQTSDHRDADFWGHGGRGSPRAPVDYEHVLRLKLGTLRDLFRTFGDAILRSPQFAGFFREAREWLQPYALYCLFRDLHGLADFTSWGRRSQMTPSHVHSLTDPSQFHYKAVSFWYFVQYLLHVQLNEVANFARGLHVTLAVDVVPSVHEHSVDAWIHPHLFHTNLLTATPKNDSFSNGIVHNKIPANWSAMARDGYRWWNSRLRHYSTYFDAVRLIDIKEYFGSFAVDRKSKTALRGRFVNAKAYTSRDLLDRQLSELDLERLVQPYIREWTVRSALGAAFAEAFLTYFEIEEVDGVYSFKETARSEWQLVELATRMGHEHLLPQLLRLQANVCLLQDRDGFHPRVGLLESTSYLELEPALREKVKKLHDEYFFGRHTEIWQSAGYDHLAAIKAAAPHMLFMADDLGELSEFSDVIGRLGLLGSRNPRIPQGPGSDSSFSNPTQYPYLCTTGFSTFNMSSVRGWWEQDQEMAKKYVHSRLKGVGELPSVCAPHVVSTLLHHLCSSTAALILCPLPDWIALDADLRSPDANERINVPTNIHNVWKYRLHAYLEDMTSSTGNVLRSSIRHVLKDTGRLPDLPEEAALTIKVPT